MFEGLIAKKLGGGMFPEKELLNIVHRHAMVAAIVLMLPAPFLEQIFFLGCVWHMYHKLAEYVGEEMGCFTILLGVGVNILLALIYSFILELLPLVGWLTTGAICYLQFYISGKIYINVLREQHQNTRHNTTQISTDRQPKQITKSSIDSIQPAKVLSNDTSTVPTPTEVPQPETIADIPTSIKNDGSSVLPDEKTTADSDKYEDKATSTKEISSKTVIKFSLVILFSILAIAVVYELCQSDKDIDNNISKVSHTDVVSPPTTTNVNVSYITVFDFLKDFYNNYVFYGAKELTPAIAEKYLTKTLAQKLIDDYPYDVDGDCYAVWELRSGFQDGPTNESKIMSVKKLSGDNYEVKIKDMGIVGTINLQITKYEEGVYRINNIGSFMQETTEADIIIDQIRSMYDNKLYSHDSWLKEHCTNSMLSYLKSINPYEDGGYCWWFFEGRDVGEDVDPQIINIGRENDSSEYCISFRIAEYESIRQLILDISLVNGSIMINQSRIRI